MPRAMKTCPVPGCPELVRRTMSRIVVALFGPSGSGKTTLACESGLMVFDRDDARWRLAGERAFRAALNGLARDPDAHAVVIRAGASSQARTTTLRTIGATHGFLVDTDQATCHYRAGHRRREDAKRSHGYIDDWFARYDRRDGIPVWPGSWELALAHPEIYVPPLAPRRTDTRSKAGDPRGSQAWKKLRARVYREETHCWRCGQWVDQSLPRNHPRSRTVDHLDPIGLGGAGVPHRSRVRLACWSCNSSRGARTETRERAITVDLSEI